jgi:hypothetical protein
VNPGDRKERATASNPSTNPKSGVGGCYGVRPPRIRPSGSGRNRRTGAAPPHRRLAGSELLAHGHDKACRTGQWPPPGHHPTGGGQHVAYLTLAVARRRRVRSTTPGPSRHDHLARRRQPRTDNASAVTFRPWRMHLPVTGGLPAMSPASSASRPPPSGPAAPASRCPSRPQNRPGTGPAASDHPGHDAANAPAQPKLTTPARRRLTAQQSTGARGRGRCIVAARRCRRVCMPRVLTVRGAAQCHINHSGPAGFAGPRQMGASR